MSKIYPPAPWAGFGAHRGLPGARNREFKVRINAQRNLNANGRLSEVFLFFAWQLSPCVTSNLPWCLHGAPGARGCVNKLFLTAS